MSWYHIIHSSICRRRNSVVMQLSYMCGWTQKVKFVSISMTINFYLDNLVKDKQRLLYNAADRKKNIQSNTKQKCSVIRPSRCVMCCLRRKKKLRSQAPYRWANRSQLCQCTDLPGIRTRNLLISESCFKGLILKYIDTINLKNNYTFFTKLTLLLHY